LVYTNGTVASNTSTIRSLTNGTYNWNVSCTDKAGNLNTSLTQTFIVDNIPPIGHDISLGTFYYNFTDAIVNSSGGDPVVVGLGKSVELSTAQGRKIFGAANFTDNLTQVFQGRLQVFNDSWITINESINDDSTYNASRSANWINFSFLIPKGHNIYEGKNISFRIIANDTVGNINNSNNVRNFTILINDTTLPSVTINGTISENGSNTTFTTISAVSWNIVENNHLLEINVSVDGAVDNIDGCGKFFFKVGEVGEINDPDNFKNFSFATTSGSTCGLKKRFTLY